MKNSRNYTHGAFTCTWNGSSAARAKKAAGSPTPQDAGADKGAEDRAPLADRVLVELEHHGALELVGERAQRALAEHGVVESTSEKTRSDAAELGVMAKTMRAALAHVGMVGWLIFHHLRRAHV